MAVNAEIITDDRWVIEYPPTEPVQTRPILLKDLVMSRRCR